MFNRHAASRNLEIRISGFGNMGLFRDIGTYKDIKYGILRTGSKEETHHKSKHR